MQVVTLDPPAPKLPYVAQGYSAEYQLYTGMIQHLTLLLTCWNQRGQPQVNKTSRDAGDKTVGIPNTSQQHVMPK